MKANLKVMMLTGLTKKVKRLRSNIHTIDSNKSTVDKRKELQRAINLLFFVKYNINT